MRKRATPVTWEQIKRAAFCREYCGSTYKRCVTTPRSMTFSRSRHTNKPIFSIAPAASSRNTGAVPQVSDTAKSGYPELSYI